MGHIVLQVERAELRDVELQVIPLLVNLQKVWVQSDPLEVLDGDLFMLVELN